MTDASLDGIVTFDEFARVTDPNIYRPLPEDWWVGVTDVVESTRAIEGGYYKSVNMAGASAISAAKNALGGRDFPFAFGGDGAQLAVPPGDAAIIHDALARAVRWVEDDLLLTLRAAMIPMRDVRKAGHEVLLANYAPSRAVRYAMFAGGGMEWAEDKLKEGAYAIEAAPPGERPDLTGLSCRWEPVKAKSGVMLSVIVRQSDKASDSDFFDAIGEFLELLDVQNAGNNPVSEQTLSFGSPLAGFDLEARAQGVSGLDRLKLILWRIMAWVIVKGRLQTGGFDPRHYRAQTVQNSDFRKFHDGLNMTLDCTDEQADAIEAILHRLENEDTIRFGLHRQGDALMTCIVPSYTADDHFHFIDGASGGYAEAARRLKQRH